MEIRIHFVTFCHVEASVHTIIESDLEATIGAFISDPTPGGDLSTVVDGDSAIRVDDES